jgi:amidase
LPVLPEAEQARMDRELMEIDIPELEELYRRHVVTVEQVTRWYLGRIAKYNGVYRDVQTVDVAGALATARREDANAGAVLCRRGGGAVGCGRAGTGVGGRAE